MIAEASVRITLAPPSRYGRAAAPLDARDARELLMMPAGNLKRRANGMIEQLNNINDSGKLGVVSGVCDSLTWQRRKTPAIERVIHFCDAACWQFSAVVIFRYAKRLLPFV